MDPLTAPLTYPGLPPQRPAVLVTGSEIFVIRPVRAAGLGQWTIRPGGLAPDENAGSPGPAGPGEPLDYFLREHAAPPIARRMPVLSVGSNASPAQIRRKMANAGLRPVVPITRVRVRGLAVGVSAHVSRAGYVPATPVADRAAVSDLWALWLDPEALRALDATEPNYQRIRLPSRYPVHLRPGPPVRGCGVYVSRHGHLIDRAGEPRRLTDQATLITRLLADVPALMALAGTSPGEWIRRTRDEGVRNGIRDLFLAAGIVRKTPIEASREPCPR
jgi:hypothetical protein